MNGFWERVAIAFRCFFSILFHGDIPNDIVQKRVKPAGLPFGSPSFALLKTKDLFARAVTWLVSLQIAGSQRTYYNDACEKNSKC